jgi:hypothetical protein
MATIDRRTIAELLTEHEDRMGLQGNTAYATRAKEFFNAAVRYCAQRWWHPELEKKDQSLAFSNDSSELDFSSLSSVPFIISDVGIRNPDGSKWIKQLAPRHINDVRGRLSATSSEPDYWSRYSTSLVLNCPALVGYEVDLWYYSKIVDFDDTNGNLELEQDWDELCLVKSLEFGHRAVWSPEIADSMQAQFNDMVSSQPNPMLTEVYQLNDPSAGMGRRIDHPGGARG